MKLKHVAIFFILIFWPISLILHNQNTDLIAFIAPTILLTVAYKYYKDQCWYYIPTLLLIGILTPKLLLFSLVFIILDYVFASTVSNKKLGMGILAALAILVLSWNEFQGQTVFNPDYEAQQLVIRNQQLYPTPFTARVFHNKFRIVGDKIIDNFFELTDPNNYFFGFAPRQVVGNQNLQKFPYLSIIPFLIGVFAFTKSKDRKFIGIALLSGLLSLSVLLIFDRNDFLLYFPITVIIIDGLNRLNKNTFATLFYLLFIAFSSIELIRILL